MCRFFGGALVLALVLASSRALADACPEDAPDDLKVRRSLAGEWFNRGKGAVEAGDMVAAVKAYSCSLRLVPHAFTAFNLGQAAEKVGDVEIGLRGFQSYLRLAPPDAPDRPEVEKKVAHLKEKLEAVKLASAEPPPRPAPAREPEPIHVAAAAPAPVETPPRNRRAIVGWSLIGGGATAVVVGVFLNLAARDKRDTYDRLWAQQDIKGANHAFDQAETYATASYVTLGVGAGLALAGTAVLLWPRADERPAVVSFLPTPGGGTFALAGRF